MKVLIVDDSSQKIGMIRNVLKSANCYDILELEHCLDLNNARLKLKLNYYDLLILDLNMPENIGEEENLEAGISFLDEIIETISIKKPTDIIILSAFDESLLALKKEVEKSGFFIIQYNETSQEWGNILKSKIEYINLCLSQRRYIPKPPNCDVLLITAVPIETNSVVELSDAWEYVQIPEDPTVYRKTCFKKENSDDISIIHVQQSDMGMTVAAAITSKAILTFKPKIIVMVGIAGGLGNDVKLGDIIVATDVWNYSSGKYVDVNDNNEIKIVLNPDPKHLLMQVSLKDKLLAQNYEQILNDIKNSFYNPLPSKALNVHFGQMACGTAVVASQELVAKQVKAHSRKVLGLDMESYGVCYASSSTTTPEVPTLIIKSVSDFADKDKNDKAQEYASYTSARFAKYIIENILDLS